MILYYIYNVLYINMIIMIFALIMVGFMPPITLFVHYSFIEFHLFWVKSQFSQVNNTIFLWIFHSKNIKNTSFDGFFMIFRWRETFPQPHLPAPCSSTGRATGMSPEHTGDLHMPRQPVGVAWHRSTALGGPKFFFPQV